jgi:ATPase subunit of ABC transporter with duplicated ATPase domains
LLLDEPDNHLDLDTVSVLEQALKQYTGALIVVSHSKDFIEALDIERSYSLVDGHL